MCSSHSACRTLARRSAICSVDRQRPPIGLRGDEDPASADDAHHLCEDARRVHDVLEGAFGARAVEGRVRERQLMGIGDPELGTGRHAGPAGLIDHHPAAVDAHHAARRRDARRKRPHVLADAAADVEDVAPRCGLQQVVDSPPSRPP
jgi:hypothetical protein